MLVASSRDLISLGTRSHARKAGSETVVPGAASVVATHFFLCVSADSGSAMDSGQRGLASICNVRVLLRVLYTTWSGNLVHATLQVGGVGDL